MKKLFFALTMLGCFWIKPMDNMDIDESHYVVEDDGFYADNRQKKRKELEAYHDLSENGNFENNPDAMDCADIDDYASDDVESELKKKKLTDEMDSDEFSYYWQYELLQAIQKDDLATIDKICIKFGHEINRFSIVGNQHPLTWAITKNNYLVTKKLLSYGADINWTPNPSECMTYNENDIPMIALVKNLRQNDYFLGILEYCLQNNAQIDSLFYNGQSIRSHLLNLKNGKITTLLEFYS